MDVHSAGGIFTTTAFAFYLISSHSPQQQSYKQSWTRDLPQAVLWGQFSLAPTPATTACGFSASHSSPYWIREFSNLKQSFLQSFLRSWVKVALPSLRISYFLHSFYFNHSQEPSTVIWEQQALIGWDPGRPAQTWAGCHNRENMIRHSLGTHCKSPCGSKQFSCWTKLKHSSSNSKEPGWLFRALCCSAFSYFTFPLLLQLFSE